MATESLEIEESELSRSCTSESLASNSTGGPVDHVEYYSEEEGDLELYGDLEQTIAGDLEQLTDSGSVVNQLELQQQQAWREYVRVKEEGLKNLQALKKKLQSSIDKTEPFVVVWRRARNLQEQAHDAAITFERAHSEHESAKETLRIAEEGIASLEEERRRSNPKEDRSRSPACQIDEAWQETLTNATERVTKTSQARLESEIEHHRLTVEFQKCQTDFKSMENRLRRSIKKSRPYYEARHKCNQRLVEIKRKIHELDARLAQNKKVYKSTMRHLESLNYILHEQRNRKRASSVMETTSEPSLLQHRARTPDFPLSLQRSALTPDVTKKGVAVAGASFSFNGSTGSLPSVEPSKATANVIISHTSPEQSRDVNVIVSDCLAKAIERTTVNIEGHEVKGHVDVEVKCHEVKDHVDNGDDEVKGHVDDDEVKGHIDGKEHEEKDNIIRIEVHDETDVHINNVTDESRESDDKVGVVTKESDSSIDVSIDSDIQENVSPITMVTAPPTEQKEAPPTEHKTPPTESPSVKHEVKLLNNHATDLTPPTSGKTPPISNNPSSKQSSPGQSSRYTITY